MQYREFFKKQRFYIGNKTIMLIHTAQLTDLDYLMKVIKKLSDANSKMYVFYSMFDLDFFVRKNYSKQTPGNEISSVEICL